MGPRQIPGQAACSPGHHLFRRPDRLSAAITYCWTTEHRQVPEDYAEGEVRIHAADIFYENDSPTLANQRLVLRNETNEFFEKPMYIVTRNFVPPDVKQISFSFCGAGTVAVVDMEAGLVSFVGAIPDHHNEPEGIIPDGKHTLVESSRQFLSEHLRDAVQFIDFCKLSLNIKEHWEYITHFANYEGFKSSNPVVRDDGRYIAFQVARRGDPAGVGGGLLLLTSKPRRRRKGNSDLPACWHQSGW